uniref:EOG090X0OY9 n=1 Tax=Simocephalus serrulatus TaxID=117539 RepID=A0A4Y7NN42_9CRUS|nr:EOG090X0OY9 [Simocephalus serrulatus]
MFHRDHGAEDLASDQTFAWPPPGFRDRRPHFGRSTDPTASATASAASSTFGQPHRKSSDQVIQSLRDELDKHRQMFFDRLAPQWESTAQRTGFPFTDTARRAFSGIDRTVPQHHPHQHPNYAFHQDDIPAWMTEDDVDPAFGVRTSAGNRQRWPSSGSGRSAGSNSSGSSGTETGTSQQNKSPGRSDSPSRPRIHKPAARSATGDFPPGSPAASPKGFCRASSAPPVAPHAENSLNQAASSPRRLFTTTVHHQPGSPSNQQQPAGDSPGPSRRHANIQHNSNSSSGGNNNNSSGSHVRHIPIMVEGRDEPLLPSVAEESQQAAEKRSKTAIPMPFYPSSSEKKSSKVPHHPPASSTSSNSSVASQQKEKEEVRDASVAIPLPYDRLSDDSGKSVGSSASVDLQTANDLELIDRIQRETETLLPRIEAFRGDRHDRGFLFLDEMLTRLLLKLDNVQVEGRDDVRHARRQAIASITRCINLLESKLLDSIERSNEGDVATAVKDSELQQQQQQPDEPQTEQCNTEEQPTNDGNPPTSPATHVTQLVINIPFKEQETCAQVQQEPEEKSDN